MGSVRGVKETGQAALLSQKSQPKNTPNDSQYQPPTNLRAVSSEAGNFGRSVPAQAVREFNTNAITAMKAEKWAEAHAILKKATELYDGRAMTLFGPRFGSFWYLFFIHI